MSVGAEEFALEEGIPLVPNTYFRTDERKQQLASEQQGRRVSDLMPMGPAGSQGTVGAVALDQHGNLAAATSTGGMTNKRQGRVGDSPIIGAGTYAKNGVCAISATGHGEYFIRAVAAYHIASSVEYRGLSLEAAARELIHSRIPHPRRQRRHHRDRRSRRDRHGLQHRRHVPRREDSSGRRDVFVLRDR